MGVIELLQCFTNISKTEIKPKGIVLQAELGDVLHLGFL